MAENIIRNNPYLQNVAKRTAQQPSVIKQETPEITLSDIDQAIKELNPSYNPTEYLQQTDSEQGQERKSRKSIDEILRDVDVKQQIQAANPEAYPEKKKENFLQLIGNTIKNTGKRVGELATGIGAAVSDPKGVIFEPLGGYLGEKAGAAVAGFTDKDKSVKERLSDGLLPVLEVFRDTSNTFFWEPLTGSSISDMNLAKISEHLSNGGEIKDIPSVVFNTTKQNLKDFGEHIYEGGALDTYLTLGAPGAGKVLGATGKGLGKVAKKVDDVAFKGKGQELMKVRQATRELRKEGAVTKAEAINVFRNWEKEMVDVARKNKISREEANQIVKAAEGKEEGLHLGKLSPELQAKAKPLLEVLDKYDKEIKKFIKDPKAAEPGNLMEVTQAMMEQLNRGGANVSYQYVKELLDRSGLLNLGKYVDDAGNVIKEDNALRAIAGEGATEAENLVYDLKNTKFIIPEGNKDILAQMALERQTPELAARADIASSLLKHYELAEAGLYHRVPHGLAKTYSDGVKLGSAGKATKNTSQYLATERVLGNATAEDIAAQILEPDNLFQHAVRGIMKDEIINLWKDKFAKTGEALRDVNSKLDDIRYVTEEDLKNIHNMSNADRLPKQIPAGENPANYIPVDKYYLQAFKNMFSPNSQMIKSPLLRDIIRLYKQQLLGSGLYLGGNFLGGLHNLITHSNVNIAEDVAKAIQTRGNLARELGVYREIDPIGIIKAHTDPNTAAGKIVRATGGLNDVLGGWVMRAADARMQNFFAESAAHSVLRKLGVKFENRNLEWMKNNLTKEQIYNAMNDIEKMAYIYGEETLIPKVVLDFMTLGNPFVRWIDQATQSSIHAIKKNPAMYGYLQGAVLGNLAWSQNEANAHRLGIDNPQVGKIYKFNPKTGDGKIVETEIVPLITSVKAASPKGLADLLTKTSKNATFGWAANLLSAKDEYGRIKEMKNWGDITPDYQRNVRIGKDGKIQEMATPKEILIGLASSTVGGQILSKTIAPLSWGILGEQSYKPYSDQLFVGPGGNPRKPYGPHEVANRLLTNYEHGIRKGYDIPYDEVQLQKLQVAARAKADKAELEKLKLQGGD